MIIVMILRNPFVLLQPPALSKALFFVTMCIAVLNMIRTEHTGYSVIA
jgi:hypothetical protein